MSIKKANLFLISVLVFLGPALWAQNSVTLSGSVVEAGSGLPVIGASVLVKGTTTGVVTDLDGNFNLSVPKASTIVISYIGFTDYTMEASKDETGLRTDY